MLQKPYVPEKNTHLLIFTYSFAKLPAISQKVKFPCELVCYVLLHVLEYTVLAHAYHNKG